MKDSGQHCLCEEGYVTEGHCGVCGHIWDAPRVKQYQVKTKLPETKWVQLPWNGEGVPPVGTEVLCNDVVFGVVKAVVSDDVAVYIPDNGLVVHKVYDLSPMLSKEDIDHNIAVDELRQLLPVPELPQSLELAEALIKAGYRKHAPMNREFSKGDTYCENGKNAISGIHCPGHGNVIECYAGTREGAELLRDEILARLI